jgi:hypothetical protein
MALRLLAGSFPFGIFVALAGSPLHKNQQERAGGLGALIKESGSHMTRPWREVDSNPRSPIRGAWVVDAIYLSVEKVSAAVTEHRG